MKFLVLMFVMAPCAALAWDGSTTDGSGEEPGYRSSFGREYQYDLSNPLDQIRYEVDPSAQIRDELDVSPIRDIERDLGQYGGGVR